MPVKDAKQLAALTARLSAYQTVVGELLRLKDKEPVCMDTRGWSVWYDDMGTAWDALRKLKEQDNG